MRACRSLLLLAVVLLFGSCARGADQQQSPLARSLAIDSWDNSRFAKFEDGTPLTVDERLETARLVARLQGLDRRVYYESPFAQVNTDSLRDDPVAYRGKAIQWRGNVVALIPSTNQADNPGDAPAADVCVGRDNQGDCWLATAAVPAAWSQLEIDGQPVGVRGVFLKLVETDTGQLVPLIATPHLAWYPATWSPPVVNYGMSVLGILGVDVTLLDDVVHRAPLMRSETAAFYKILAGMHGTTAHELVGWAERHMPRHRQRWSDELRDPTSKHRRLAAEVLRQAEEGRFAVAPFFNTPGAEVGELAAFDGLVRRALRIDTTGDIDAAAAGIDHYYELALFTEDSRNNPLMFCVLEVPPNLPLGDDIRQPVRVAGFFFKNWRYSSRRADETGDEQLRLAPMFIGCGPLEIVEQPENPAWAILAGGAFVAAILGIWAASMVLGRRDRAFAEGTLHRLQQSDQPWEIDESDLPGPGV